MSTLADFCPQLRPAPTPSAARFALIQHCPDPAGAVSIAFQNRKTHPAEPVEIWPVPESKERIVVREVYG